MNNYMNDPTTKTGQTDDIPEPFRTGEYDFEKKNVVSDLFLMLIVLNYFQKTLY